LAVPIGTINLLPICALLLALSIPCMRQVIAWHRSVTSASGAPVEEALGGNMFAAFRLVLTSPYLMRIALFVFLVTWVSTFLYLEQQAMVAKIFTLPDERTRFFAGVDLWVQSLALVIQLFVFGRLYKWLGLTALIAAVPVLMTGGYLLYALVPSFSLVVILLILRRAGEYAITRPCRDTLYTITSRESKYKAKSLIDTFVYRGGDATSGSLHKALTGSLGLTSLGIGCFGAIISGLWLWLALSLGGMYARSGSSASGSTDS
jgi:AAA family ATP:ADP antiporter